MPLNIYIGSDDRVLVARKVLEFSILRRSTTPVTLTPMEGKEWEYPTGGIPVGTGFSFRRWMIPKAAGWEGMAVYMDADQLVLSDVAELELRMKAPSVSPLSCTYQPIRPGQPVSPQTSVMGIDCSKVKDLWAFDLDSVIEKARGWSKKQYDDFMQASWAYPPPAKWPTAWNHLDYYRPKVTRLLHYTRMNLQPWYNPKHPHAGVWQIELRTALEMGYVTREDLELALSRWEGPKAMRGLHPDYSRYREFAVL